MGKYMRLFRISPVKWFSAVWLSAACLFVLAPHCFAMDKIIAIVNNDAITQKDLDDFNNFMRVEMSRQNSSEQVEAKIKSLGKDLLDRLIEDRLILQEARKNDIRIDQNRVRARLDEIRSRYSSEREFQGELAKQGLVIADVETKIKEQMLMYFIVESKVRSKIVVAPEEVTSFYDKNKDKFMLPEQREIESLSTDDENVIRDIYARLQQGKNMSDLANELSLKVNKISAFKGELRPDIEEIVFKLQVNQIYAPAKIKNTYYIFKVLAIKPPRQQLLSEVQDQINKFLYDRKMQEGLTKWLDEIKSHSYIKIIKDQ